MATASPGVGFSFRVGRGVYLQSRGILFLVAALALGFTLRKRNRAEKTPETFAKGIRPLLVIGGGVLVTLALALTSERLFQEFLTTVGKGSSAGDKTQLWALIWLFVQDNWAVGAGLNGLGGGLSHYFTLDASNPMLLGRERIYFAENILLDLLGAFGLLGTALIAASCLHAGWQIKIRQMSSWGLAGLFFIFGAELVDFALVTPCILWLSLALFCLCNVKATPTLTLKTSRAFLLWLLSGPLIYWLIAVSVPGDRKALDLALLNASEVEQETLTQAITHHPFDANLSFAIAAKFREQGDFKKSLRWGNYALLVWPTLDGAHMEVARTLALMGRFEQAALEYRLALKANSRFRSTVVSDLSYLRFPPKLRLSAVPANDSESIFALCNTLDEKGGTARDGGLLSPPGAQ